MENCASRLYPWGMKYLFAALLLLCPAPLLRASTIYIGTNPSGNADWGLQDFTADVPMRAPGELGSPWDSDSTISIDGAGDVTAPNGFGTYLEAYNYPNGVYTLTFTATDPTAGQLQASGIISILSQTISGNTVTAQVQLTHNAVTPAYPNPLQNGSGWFGWTSGYGTVGDIQLTQPGLTPGGLTPWGLSYLSSYQAIRFMNLDNVNDNIGTNDTAQVPTSTNNGLQPSYAEQAQWANAAYTAGGGKLNNIEIEVPVTATDAYIQAVAQQISSVLNPKIAVKFELGNELWNTATFSQAGYVLNLAEHNSSLQGSDAFGQQGQEAGILEYHAAQVFEQAMGSNFNVTGVLGGQGTNTYFADKGREGIENYYGVSQAQLDSVLGDVAVSVYPGDSITSATSVADLFSQVRADFASQATGMAQAEADAKAAGQILDVYEWSPKGYLTTGGVSSSIVDAAIDDPGMYTLTQDLYNEVIAPYLMNGSTVYAFDGPGSGWGSQVDPSTSPDQEWLAMQALLATNTGVPEPTCLPAIAFIGWMLSRRLK